MLAKILNKRLIADRTVEVVFTKPSGFTFKPGQSIDLTIPSLQDDNTRAFSLVSSPDEENLIIATRLRESRFKKFLEELEEGAEVEVNGPYGSMTLHRDVSKPAVFLAGGIGITPFVSMLRYITRNNLSHRVYLFYSNRRKEDIAYFDEMRGYAEKFENIKVVFTLTKQTPSDWNREIGYIDGEMIKRYVEVELSSCIFYLAGPPRFSIGIRKVLEALDISDDNIRGEDFTGYD